MKRIDRIFLSLPPWTDLFTGEEESRGDFPPPPLPLGLDHGHQNRFSVFSLSDNEEAADGKKGGDLSLPLFLFALRGRVELPFPSPPQTLLFFSFRHVEKKMVSFFSFSSGCFCFESFAFVGAGKSTT